MAEKGDTFHKAGLELEIRPLNTKDVDQVHELALSVGWTFSKRQTLRDINRCFPGAMFGAFDTENTLISTCSFFPVDDNTRYFTYYITRPQHQHKGIGKLLYKETLQCLNNPDVLLLAMEDTIPLYTAWGYKASKHCCKTFRGKLRISTAPDKIYHIEPVQKHFDKVVTFDKDFVSTTNRGKIFQIIFDSPQFVAAECAVLDGRLQGFIIILHDDNGAMRASAFQARNFDTAVALLSHAAKEIVPGGTEFAVNYSQVNSEACSKLYTAFGLAETEPHFQCMYLGKDMDYGWEYVYGVLFYAVSIV